MRYLGLLLFSLSAFGYSPDYFPLQVGNQWVYRVTGLGQPSYVTVSVTRVEERQGERWASVEGLAPAPVLLRHDDEGRLLSLNPQAAGSVWAEFARPEGAEYFSGIDACSSRAKIANRNATVSVPAGTYGGALQINYSGACADAGVTSEHYLPWIGLVRRESTSIAGPRVMELIYSRTGGVTTLSQPETSFALSLGAATVPRGTANLEARLTMRATAAPVTLDFTSSQRFDFSIRNDRGDTVYTWSATRLFLAVVGQEVISGERNWIDALPVSTLPEGRYSVEGWLTTSTGKRYQASVGFEVVAPR